MNMLQILAGGILGTTLMTGFSYLISRARKKQFREPELLNELLVRVRLMKFSASRNHPAGWIMHYVVGLMFISIYQVIILITGINDNLIFYSIAGLVSGFVGVAIWDITLRLHPNPPMIDLKEFYLQLIAAHVIFGVFAYLGVLLSR